MHHQLLTTESTANGLVANTSSLPDLMRFLRGFQATGFMFDLWAHYFAGSAVFGVHKKE